MKTLQVLERNAVILSEGEPTNFFLPGTFPEPRSKDLARPSLDHKRCQKISLHKEHFPRIASTTRAKMPRLKKAFRDCATPSSMQTRSFDFGSGSVIGKTTWVGSPSLRMTKLFLQVPTFGGNP